MSEIQAEGGSVEYELGMTSAETDAMRSSSVSSLTGIQYWRSLFATRKSCFTWGDHIINRNDNLYYGCVTGSVFDNNNAAMTRDLKNAAQATASNWAVQCSAFTVISSVGGPSASAVVLGTCVLDKWLETAND
jgi:hypothetical protein